MAYAEGTLDGSGPFYVTVNVWRTGTNDSGNYSTFYWEVGVRSDGGWPTWSGSAQQWSFRRDSDGWNPSGTWTLDFRNTNGYIVGNGYMDVAHNADGTRPGFPNRGSIGSSHSSVGNGWTAQAWVDAPRIPKRPSPPGTPTVSELDADSLRLSWSGSSDNGGSSINGYLLRSWPGTPSNPGSTGGYTDHSFQNNTSRVVSGFSPGEVRTFAVYARNGAADNSGYSNISGHVVVTFLAGIYVSDGSKWVAQPLKVSTGSEWVGEVPEVSTGSVWEEPE